MFLAFTSRSDLYIIQSDDYWVDFSIGNKRKEAFIQKKKKILKNKNKNTHKIISMVSSPDCGEI